MLNNNFNNVVTFFEIKNKIWEKIIKMDKKIRNKNVRINLISELIHTQHIRRFYSYFMIHTNIIYHYILTIYL